MITLNKSLEFKRAMFGCFVKTFTKGHPLIFKLLLYPTDGLEYNHYFRPYFYFLL